MVYFAFFLTRIWERLYCGELGSGKSFAMVFWGAGMITLGHRNFFVLFPLFTISRLHDDTNGSRATVWNFYTRQGMRLRLAAIDSKGRYRSSLYSIDG